MNSYNKHNSVCCTVPFTNEHFQTQIKPKADLVIDKCIACRPEGMCTEQFVGENETARTMTKTVVTTVTVIIQ